MSRLEDLQPNAAVRGIQPDALVSVVSVQWFGSEALELTYKNAAGKVANELLYRHDEPRIQVVEHGRQDRERLKGAFGVPCAATAFSVERFRALRPSSVEDFSAWNPFLSRFLCLRTRYADNRLCRSTLTLSFRQEKSAELSSRRTGGEARSSCWVRNRLGS